MITPKYWCWVVSSNGKLAKSPKTYIIEFSKTAQFNVPENLQGPNLIKPFWCILSFGLHAVMGTGKHVRPSLT
jgi:hypothetical protein